MKHSWGGGWRDSNSDAAFRRSESLSHTGSSVRPLAVHKLSSESNTIMDAERGKGRKGSFASAQDGPYGD